MKESGQKGCVVFLHYTTPHFPNPFWLFKHVNMKKSLAIKLYIMKVWLAYVFMKTSTEVIESGKCQLS